MAFFEWDESYSVNCNVINNHHKKLFQIVNDLYEVFIENAHSERLDKIINQLHVCTVSYFREEEKLLAEKEHKISHEHYLQHKEFVKMTREFRYKYYTGRISVTHEMISFLRSWLVSHIQGADKEYAIHFKSEVNYCSTNR